ncbi:MAG: thiol-disulfide isomerase/thioredoxin [Limisphaerales bacterium]
MNLPEYFKIPILGCNAMTEPSTPPLKEKKKAKPSIPAITILLLILLGVLIFRPAIAAEAALRGLLEADAPDPQLVEEAIHRSKNPARVLTRLWSTGKIPHRWEVISYINRNLLEQPDLLTNADKIIEEAPIDRDITVRFMGLNLMRLLKHPGWLEYSRYQLEDPDSEIRSFALKMFERGKATNALPDIVKHFDDTDPAVAQQARNLFEVFTGVGPVPENAHAGYPTDPARSWWETNHLRFPILPTLQPRRLTAALDLGEVPLLDAKGTPVKISDYAGKPLILALFSSWSFKSKQALRALNEVEENFENKVSIRAVSIDAVPGVKHDHSAKPDAAPPSLLNPDEFTQLQEKIAYVLKQNRVSYGVLFDYDGSLTWKVEGSELPTFLIIGQDSKLIRRFSGERSTATFTNIIHSVLTD